jgi:hypothetical protein
MSSDLRIRKIYSPTFDAIFCSATLHLNSVTFKGSTFLSMITGRWHFLAYTVPSSASLETWGVFHSQLFSFFSLHAFPLFNSLPILLYWPLLSEKWVYSILLKISEENESENLLSFAYIEFLCYFNMRVFG